jgi:hypothetical protein
VARGRRRLALTLDLLAQVAWFLRRHRKERSELARQCAFCDRDANSVEDALPLWLADVIGPEPGERVYHSTDTTYRETNVMRLKVRRVCTVCNNEWMSNLEKRAKPLLLPMIEGRPTVIAEERDKRTLGAWALKTLMMLEYAKPERESLIPRPHCVFLRTYQRPPQQVKVWMGALPAELPNAPRARRFWERATYRKGPLPASDELKLYLGAISIKQLVFRIEGFFGDDVVRRYMDKSGRPRLEDLALQIWPPGDDQVKWPPPMLETEESLRAFLDN